LCPEAVARVEGVHPTTVQRTQLFKSYYNLCRKHGTLKGKTPAQAAGLSDHCWTLRELLTFNAAITSKIP
jgi:hypothetical protein